MVIRCNRMKAAGKGDCHRLETKKNEGEGNAMAGNLLLRSVRLTNGEMADIAIRDGLVSGIGRDLAGDQVIEGAGRLALPALVEAHAHLDKTLWGTGWPSNSAGPTLRDYIDNERRILRGVKTPIADR